MDYLSIIIPVKNEKDNIGILLNRITKSLRGKSVKYEIIMVDDASTDNTLSYANNLKGKYPRLQIHKNPVTIGRTASIFEGFKFSKYGLILTIDANLQYPPDYIPLMLAEMRKGYDIIIGNRQEYKVSLRRKKIGTSYKFLFAKYLNSLNYDVLSGLKLFRREIIERIELSSGTWTFDLEMLIKSREAGYTIGSIDIVFDKRYSEKSKIRFIKSLMQMIWSALKLKFTPSEIILFHPKQEAIRGKGFHFKRAEFIHHSSLDRKESAFRTAEPQQKIIIAFIIGLLIFGLLIYWEITLIIVIALLTILYFADLLFNFFLIYRSFVKKPEIKITDEEINKVTNWPTYTILCPLYKEWQVLSQFITSMSRLDYPKNKLEVLLILEEDDLLSIEKVKTFKLPLFFKIIIVPHSLPKTKPKALNYGLNFTKGEYCVVYDAEDVPEKSQLKKAVVAFSKADPKIVCMQAKLSFYNPYHNLITRFFTAEYSLWFNLVLTGLQSINAPIPLGGTSNHFKTQSIRDLKGWDSFNVTEDCDLGMRLIKYGFNTAIIESQTLEEANSSLKNWFEQRTRWIKGYMQTYLVHSRDLKQFNRDIKQPHFITFQLIVGGKILSTLINPLMWAILILYFSMRSTIGTSIEQFFPKPILYMGTFSLVFGNFLYMYHYMIGCTKREFYNITKYALLVPIYWLGMSLAAYVAIYRLIKAPHYWSKTKHGLHLNSNKTIQQSILSLGENLVDSNIATFRTKLSMKQQ